MIHYNLKKSRDHVSLQKCYIIYFELPDDFILQKVSTDFSVQTVHLSLFCGNCPLCTIIGVNDRKNNT